MSQQRKFGTALIDPPWDINQRGNYGAIHHYDLMSLDRIKAMPVAGLMEENSHIWLWIPTNLMEKGFEVVRAWGFEPKSVMVWIKPRMGLGQYLRSATEMVILGARGKAPILCNNQPNWLFAPFQGHSHKPEEQYAIIERCSPGPYLELFARRRQLGWTIWGFEAPGGSDIDIPGYPVPNSPAARKLDENPKGGEDA
jgi:N6-adenosine-specific RNA methylase IME4